MFSGVGLTWGYSWASHSGDDARSMNSASSASSAAPARRPASVSDAAPQRLLGLPPQLGDAVVGLLHAAPGPGQGGVHRVVEAVGLRVAQDAERGLVGGDDRAVVEAPAVAELGERQARACVAAGRRDGSRWRSSRAGRSGRAACHHAIRAGSVTAVVTEPTQIGGGARRSGGDDLPDPVRGTARPGAARRDHDRRRRRCRPRPSEAPTARASGLVALHVAVDGLPDDVIAAVGAVRGWLPVGATIDIVTA